MSMPGPNRRRRRRAARAAGLPRALGSRPRDPAVGASVGAPCGPRRPRQRPWHGASVAGPGQRMPWPGNEAWPGPSNKALHAVCSPRRCAALGANKAPLVVCDATTGFAPSRRADSTRGSIRALVKGSAAQGLSPPSPAPVQMDACALAHGAPRRRLAALRVPGRLQAAPSTSGADGHRCRRGVQVAAGRPQLSALPASRRKGREASLPVGR